MPVSTQRLRKSRKPIKANVACGALRGLHLCVDDKLLVGVCYIHEDVNKVDPQSQCACDFLTGNKPGQVYFVVAIPIGNLLLWGVLFVRINVYCELAEGALLI